MWNYSKQTYSSWLMAIGPSHQNNNKLRMTWLFEMVATRCQRLDNDVINIRLNSKYQKSPIVDEAHIYCCHVIKRFPLYVFKFKKMPSLYRATKENVHLFWFACEVSVIDSIAVAMLSVCVCSLVYLRNGSCYTSCCQVNTFSTRYTFVRHPFFVRIFFMFAAAQSRRSKLFSG